MILTNEKLTKRPRTYYPADMDVTSWPAVEKEWQALLDTPLRKVDDLIAFIEKTGEFRAILGDEATWRYINMTCNADKEEYTKAYSDFYANIVCNSEIYDFKCEKKYYDSELKHALPAERYAHFDRIVSNSIEMFREENSPLKVREQELYTKYSSMMSQMTVMYKGEEKTLTQLSVHMKNPDRAIREEVWHLMMNRMKQDADELNRLFEDLKAVRIQIAKNAGFDNYRDFKHKEKGRFGYTPADLYKFHDAVEKAILPFLRELSEERKEALGVDTLRPWDKDVDLDGKVLRPFENVGEFVDHAIDTLGKVKPDYGVILNMMKNTGLLDLENRKGKAPGGYNAPIDVYGSSFIFMNAVGLHDDVTTLLHESGHAMHSYARAEEMIFAYKNTPEEVAELASMSMEFMTMNYWDEYYKNPEDLKKAKRDQLTGALKFMPWCMIVDAFQQWIYTHPEHTPEERLEYFGHLMDRFGTGIDYTGLDREKQIAWIRQLHIFEVPFYYIEYGMAQLGALAVYKNYKENPAKALEMYQNFLNLGYTKPTNELYEAAGVKFDFTEAYIREIVEFVKEELKALK